MKREIKTKPHKSAIDALEKSEVDKLIFACKNDRERLIVIGLVHSGMRVGEFVHMKRDWIDWQSKQIIIPEKQKCGCCECKNENRGEFWSPKTKAGVRKIPIKEASLEKIFRVHFTFNDGIDLSKVAVFNMVKRIAKRAGIMKRVYPHSLRATFATEWGYRVSAPALAYIMGWSDYFTAEQYVRSQEKRALEEIDSA